MKLQNIFALIVTLISFAACTSESELPDTTVSSDLVPVTINLGSIQTKAVNLENGEGTIQNAVIGIFDSKGIPTVTPIVLENGESAITTDLPGVPSYAYAFVNVSEADITNLQAISRQSDFIKYIINKELGQDATQLPKFGGTKNSFTPAKSTTMIDIPVKQLTARVEVMVDIKVFVDGVEIQNSGFSLSEPSSSWTNMLFNSYNNATLGNDGSFTTTINNVEYQTLNRAYSYPEAKPTISLSGTIIGEKEGFDGMSSFFTYTFKEGVKADNVYIVRFIAKVDITDKVNPTLTYEVLNEAPINVNVPSFN